MDDKRIDSFGALHDAVQECGKKTIIFRGVKDINYGLVPKVGRYKKFKELSIEKLEKEEKNYASPVQREGMVNISQR